MAIIFSASAAPFAKKVAAQKIEVPAALKTVKPVQRAPQATAALESGTYYTQSGNFYVYDEGWVDYTSEMPSITVAVEGSKVTITGLAYWFDEASIQGTMDGNTITFANGQLLGTDQYGDEYLIGSNDGETVCDIVFTFDPEANTLTSNTMYIMESEKADEVSIYTYWYSPVFGVDEPETPEVVALPDGVQTSSYKFEGKDADDESAVAFQVLVGFDGSDVYIQGLSQFLPDAWVKGTLAAGVVTIPETYLGVFEYYGYKFPFTLAATTMTYDATNNKFTCASYTITTSGSSAEGYKNVTLTKMAEVAATPVEPEIKEFAVADEDYPFVEFTINMTGTNGEELLAAKTSYIFYVQKGNESSPLVFTTDLYTKLEANMTEIPYTFSDEYDIYNDGIYLNQSESELRSWDKLGLQTIYRAAGEEHKSTINWFDVHAYWVAVDGGESAVENAEVALKAVKRIENGQLIIEKNGKLYNVLGTIVK